MNEAIWWWVWPENEAFGGGCGLRMRIWWWVWPENEDLVVGVA